tara:strand:+ start:245 stop:496 length:252 start_codon:yes stop_codon:yes gene_type:complete
MGVRYERAKECIRAENKKIEEKIANTNQSIANLELKNEKRWVNIDDSMNGLIAALNSINFNNKLSVFFMGIMVVLLAIIILKS